MAKDLRDIRAVAVIPARLGSKGVPKKNIRLLAGRPMIAYTIDAAKESEYVSRVIVTSESHEIGKIAEDNGAEWLERPAYLAEDEVSLDAVIIHAVKTSLSSYPFVVTLQPTVPIRPRGLVDACIERLIETDCNSILTVHEGPHFAWRKQGINAIAANRGFTRKMRQHMSDYERIYLENGSCYVTKRGALFSNLHRLPVPLTHYEIPEEYGIDVDTEYDFWLAEKRLEYMRHPAKVPA